MITKEQIKVGLIFENPLMGKRYIYNIKKEHKVEVVRLDGGKYGFKLYDETLHTADDDYWTESEVLWEE